VPYLSKDRGLAERPVLVYKPFVRDLLTDQVAKTAGVSVQLFDATAVRGFLLDHICARSLC
jgi:hypothetical protein